MHEVQRWLLGCLFVTPGRVCGGSISCSRASSVHRLCQPVSLWHGSLRQRKPAAEAVLLALLRQHSNKDGKAVPKIRKIHFLILKGRSGEAEIMVEQTTERERGRETGDMNEPRLGLISTSAILSHRLLLYEQWKACTPVLPARAHIAVLKAMRQSFHDARVNNLYSTTRKCWTMCEAVADQETNWMEMRMQRTDWETVLVVRQGVGSSGDNRQLRLLGRDR